MANKTPAGTTDEVLGKDFKVDLVINDTAEVYVYHNKPFTTKLSWLEFDLDTNNLDFVLNDGDVRRLGAKVPDHQAKHMQNAYQVMMVHMDDAMEKPLSGDYFPLIIHRA